MDTLFGHLHMLWNQVIFIGHKKFPKYSNHTIGFLDPMLVMHHSHVQTRFSWWIRSVYGKYGWWSVEIFGCSKYWVLTDAFNFIVTELTREICGFKQIFHTASALCCWILTILSQLQYNFIVIEISIWMHL